MNFFRIVVVICTIFNIIFMSQIVNASTQLIPRRVLFSNPDKMSVSLTHDGKHLLYIAPKNGVLNIWIAPNCNLSKALPITDDKGRGILHYSISYDNENIIYYQDNKGDENFRLYNYNLKTKKTTLLTPEHGVRAYIVEQSHKIPNEILIACNERDPQYFDIYKLNLKTLEKSLIFKNERFTGFIFDSNLHLRYASSIDAEGNKEYWEYKDNHFHLYTKVSLEDSMNTFILGLDVKGHALYMLDGRNRNTSALTVTDLSTNKVIVLAQDALADVELFTTHPTKNIIQGVYVNYDRVSYKVLDQEIKKDIEYLQSLDHGDLVIVMRTLDDKSWIIAYDKDNEPTRYYKYNRDDRKAEFLFTKNSELEKYNLAKMRPVIIKSRDGLNLVSYITYPLDVKLDKNNIPDKKVPLILYVHGGPWARDSWGYNAVHQWLANRGYAVLSINYRGSTGFGKEFLNAGSKEWGRKMHDDLIDGVNWAIRHNIAEPDKICIMGGSYGGYATLVGLTMTPQVFACGVDIVGVSNLLTFVHSVPSYWKPYLNYYKKRIGPWDTKEDQEFLRQRSPITFVDNIIKPLFIAQGAHDPRVVQRESDQIVQAMESRSIPVVYALYEDEGHGFIRPENRISYYALVEQFLARVLYGKSENIGKDLENSSLVLNGKKGLSEEEAERVIHDAVGEQQRL